MPEPSMDDTCPVFVEEGSFLDMETSMPPKPRYAILELGLRCNLRCLHCASGSGQARPGELPLAIWQEVVRDLALLGCRSVDLMGGEVLLSPLLEPVGEALSEAGIPWGILSNGWLLDRDRGKALLDLGCRGIGVSLDGATAETHDGIRGRPGAWQRALQALDVVAELPTLDGNRTVLTSVNRRNLDELDAMGDLLEVRFPGFRWQLNLTSAGAPRMPPSLRPTPDDITRVARFIDGRRRGKGRLHVSGAHDLGYFRDDLDLHAYEWAGCPAGIHNLGVQSDGKVKGCLALDERHAVGNVRETALRELWQDESRMAAYRRFSVEQLGPDCQGCVWGSRCRGGCLAYADAAAGQEHDHPHCLWRKASCEERLHAVSSFAGAVPATGNPYLPHKPALRSQRPLPDTSKSERKRFESVWPLPLLSACIELTLRCNLRCLHCGSAAGLARSSELGLAEFIDVFADLRALGGQRVVLLGGEPLLHPDWQEIVTMAKGFGLRVALISNGLCVTPAVAEALAALGLEAMGISLDGASDAVHDRLRGAEGARLRAWAAIDRLQAAGVPVTIITTVMRGNLAELPLLRDQLAARGGLIWQIQSANGTGERFLRDWMPSPADLLSIARLVEEVRRTTSPERLAVATGHNIGHHACSVGNTGAKGTWRGCPGGITSIGIASDGAVKGCLSMQACEIVGNLRERRLRELWRDLRTFARNRRFTPGRLTGGCAACPHGWECRAGCPEMARTATGDVWDNPFCLRQAEKAAT
jgi:radical SAM protein with 4Fe4S-binding SPASM domain